MIHPDTRLQFISPEVGYGVFATRLIPRGTLTWVLDPLDQRVPPTRSLALGPYHRKILQHFGCLDAEGHTVIAWDHGRFVNHSCEPSCASGGDDRFEVALRDIQPGEELTDDYGELRAFEAFPCACGAPSCRGVVHPRAQDPGDALRLLVAEALALAARVPQPLVPLGVDPAALARMVGRSPAPAPGV